MCTEACPKLNTTIYYIEAYVTYGLIYGCKICGDQSEVGLVTL